MKDLHGINLTKLTDEQMCREKLQTEVIRNVTDLILKFSEAVISIADETIPKTSTNPKHPDKPWFNDDYKDTINNRKRAERRFVKHPTISTISASSGRKLDKH